VGYVVSDVINGRDARKQRAFEQWKAWQASKVHLKKVKRNCLLAGSLISLFIYSQTWWFVVLVPLTAAVCLSIIVATARSTRLAAVKITNEDMPSPADSRQLSASQLEMVGAKYVAPFLKRNENSDSQQSGCVVAVKILSSLNQVNDVRIGNNELDMLERTLRTQAIQLWKNRGDVQVILSAFALQQDFRLFEARMEQMESSGVDLLTAYASLLHGQAFLEFLTQLLVNRGEPTANLMQRIQETRRQLTHQGFERDLEQRRHGSLSLDIAMIDGMDPYDFELLLGMFYEAQGFHVIETPKSGDQGADVLLEKAGEKTVIQAKLYSGTVGNKAVQEAIAASSHFRCNFAAVVTNNYFTRSAKELAQSSTVTLVDRDELIEMIRVFNQCPKDYARLASLFQPQ